ncbi:imidazole glycerol phosphate synthase subunit HisH [Veillonella sp. YH-vei2232]|jgi:glutamine amidotransferase|uniref:Imidazole glycerol phosphate synthase subunit HisH n=1 Tax=Veillonella absiana TaxID=3079305 RepID=A0ABU3Z8N0_9FIRM|nr:MULTISPECIES: imidazole glycerol phosphate synthase subunit HisH [unclassified Veillonella]NCB95930.1 imidazole glycerol phosphate synthase subunit HisH [Negativicutes bacterium]MBP6923159.1 imidazole glycerol phosphate synthase subunit HisH [Veillonella sp.]MBP8615998.1 imidazole glycerol phosphate synthase subunit HisH [Veillonella sp.]MBP9516812.1 imidazole glycerol phosphate synthase subunit HisH [Veillonella sp.]MBP9550933.1 imidazole glycerol phosphate synthase subunit HisH [Veillonel
MIAIVDYDAGNTFNVQKAFAHLGVDTVLTADPEVILNSDGVVLPGVGAFKAAMDTLVERKLVDVLKQVAEKNIPLLGICLGMQLLFDSSTEYGLTEGLGLIPGTVEALPADLGLMIPHMGWNQNLVKNHSSIFADVADREYTYFVHSYYAKCDDQYITTTADYGVDVPGIVERDSVYGMQFHPEKSAHVGLNLLRTFVERTKG